MAAVGGPFDAELSHLAAQRVRIEAEEVGSSAFSFDAAVREHERACDVIACGFGQGLEGCGVGDPSRL